MMRPGHAVLAAAGLLLLWLGLIAIQSNGDLPASLAALGDGAQRMHLPGLAAKGYLLASVRERQQLAALDRKSAAARLLVQHIIAHRMAAARTLLDAGYVEASERIALEGARANYDDVQARALLLEIRLRGRDPESARRELMYLVLKTEDPQLLCLLGQSFAALSRPEDAASFYHRALARDPGHLPTLIALARLASSRGDREGVAQWLHQASQSAERPDEKRAVLRLRPLDTDPWRRTASAVALVWHEHSGTFLFLLAYLALLAGPALVSLVWRPGGFVVGLRRGARQVAAGT